MRFGRRTRRRVWVALGGSLGAALLPRPRGARAQSGAPDAALDAALAVQLGELLSELRDLLRRRGAAGRALEAAAAAERAGRGERAGIAGTLRRLVAGRSELDARLAGADAEVAALEAALEAAREDGGGSARDRLATELASSRRLQSGAVDLLGQTNTEIAHWQVRADAAARRVGDARSRALAASVQIAALEETGPRRAAEAERLLARWGLEPAHDGRPAFAVWEAAPDGELAPLLNTLRREHAELLGPAPVAGTLETAEQAWPPALWPSGPAPRYAPPRGGIAAALVAAAPLAADAARASVGARAVTADGADGTGGWVPPVAGPITTAYGSSTPYFPTHWAVDIGARLYAPVVAAASGRVEHVGLATPGQPLANHGMVVVVRHAAGVASLYAHLDGAAFAPAVRQGEEVVAGQRIGHAGLTGYSTGPHLHFEVRLENRPIDPGLLVPLRAA